MKTIIALFFAAFFADASVAQDQTQTQSQPNQAQEGQQGWFKQNSGTTNGLGGVKFTSKDTGWVASGGGVILRTVDGGQNWVQLTVPDPLGVTCIDAVDGKTAWCSNSDSHGNMFFTSDGGQSWVQQNPNSQPEPVVAISFFTKNLGLGVGSSFLIKTTNGGQTWVNYSLEGATYRAMHFLDSQNGLIAGNDNFTQDGFLQRIILGGPARFMQKDTIFSKVFLIGCCLASPSREFAVGGDKQPAIIRTKDGGKTWDRATIPVEFLTAGMNAITFTDSLHGTVVGDQGAILHTTDGGDTWIKQESHVTSGLVSVSFADSLNGTIVGELGVILHTTNGGYSWVNSSTNFDSLKVQTYPDPATSYSINFNYTLPSVQHISLTLYDISGHIAQVLFQNDFESAGEHTMPFSLQPLANGNYFYLLQSERYQATGKITILH